MTSDKLQLRVGDLVYDVTFRHVTDSREINSYTAGKVNLFRVADAIECTVFSAYDRVGWAFRSHNDMPDTYKGEKIAFGRAIKIMPKHLRRELWHAYLAVRPVRSRQFDALRKWLSTQASPAPKPTRRVPAITQQEEF